MVEVVVAFLALSDDASQPQVSSPAPTAAERRGRNIATVVFLLFAAWFIVSTVAQLAVGAFHEERPLPPESACRSAIAPMLRAVDVATNADPSAPGTFEGLLGPAWSNPEVALRACRAEAGGENAYLSVLRYHDAAKRRRTMHGDALVSTRARAALFLQ